MAKAKKDNRTMTKKDNGTDLEAKVERLELLSVASDVENMGTKRAALQTKLQQLQAEGTLAQQNLKEVTERGQELLQQFQTAYAAYKAKLKVPEGKEVNLRTGEIVDAPSEGQQSSQ